MFLLGVFLIAFATVATLNRMRNQGTLDCLHRGAIAGIFATIIAFALALIFS